MENTAARKRKQVPQGYLIIGIDPHKKRRAAVAITQDFTTRDKFKFDNTREGLETLLRRAKTEMVKSSCRGVIFAIETGGHYWRNAAYFLDEQGIPFRFINQFTLKRRREGKYLLSIVGLNYISVAGLLAELGSFKQYRSAKQLIKMAGTNPTESESAGKRGSHTPMSKKGRLVLRYCAWTAVIPMLRFNCDFRA